ncbi:tripartite tricarboxylate transporter TctB family protein [Acuticoccus sp. M5D2P5]|uniref:tripartite tricarboxylate transporter TctB family protein n=1 Tax=Acuticoccus kalidii TaxID=2910977 RepID=UPI001F21A392|nr:tripartite tricarboxylate transporter TctB family protein [Acuticoccus kalidii]MCF3935380.1 tripartite tricarboxylate transporter TctB family protein [Acuticoccus kalidii]
MDDEANERDLTVEFGVPVFFGLWAVIGWWAILGDSYVWTDFGLDPGPVLMPVLVLSFLSIGAVIMFARAVLLTLRRDGRFEGRIFRNLWIPAVFAGSVLLMVPVMYRIGFLATALIFAFGWMCVLAEAWHGNWKRRLLMIVIASAVGVGLLTYIFAEVIRVPLP